MQAQIDHVVVWVGDPLAAVDFYQDVVGLAGLRVAEYRDGKAPFPSLRVSDNSLIDLMARSGAPKLDASYGTEGTAGNLINHICLAMDHADFVSLRERLEARGIRILATMAQSFGARGLAPETFYFCDPDSNVIEARYYA